MFTNSGALPALVGDTGQRKIKLPRIGTVSVYINLYKNKLAKM